MTSDFTGFNFLPPLAFPVSDAKRGYATGTAMPDPSTTGTTTVAGAAVTVDKTAGHGVEYGAPIARLEF